MKTIFSRLMFYLSGFFLIFCLITYLGLSSFFESYYTQSRTELLKEKSAKVKEIYNHEGLTPKLEGLLDAMKEEGTVIQILEKEETKLLSPESENKISEEEILLGSSKEETCAVVTNEEQTQVKVAEQGQGQGKGLGKGQGKGQGSGQGSGQMGAGMQKSLESQVSEHQEGETFVTTLGNKEHRVDWLTYKSLADDETQVIARIPSYSIHDVIQIVQNFLLVFLLIIFGSSLIFAYFFAQGISKPMIYLNKIAKEMGELVFNQKYQGKRKDEIGQLGKTLNHISNTLENTIEELQGELNKERTLEKMRQRFNAQVSHEIQTPLAVIKSYAEALEDELIENPKERMDCYKTIAMETDKVSSIASDLLDLSQIESGAYRLKKERSEGDKILASVVERMKHINPQKNIDLETKKSVILDIDRKRMEQVFYNLLNNATKHVSPEDGKIEVKSEIKNEVWVVSVYNEGKNIPENEIDQIWGYFYKAKSDKKGTGLGLAIVDGIIKCHQGESKVFNREKGVCFEIALPIK